MNSQKTSRTTMPNSQTEIQQTIKSLTLQINQDPFSQQNHHKYIERSQILTYSKDYHSAILDLSKSLYIEPTYSAYVQRGKLLIGNQQYVDAVLDFQEARRIYGEGEKNMGKETDFVEEYLGDEYNNWDITKPVVVPRLPPPKVVEAEIKNFLDNSTFMLNLGKIKGIAEEHQQIRQFMCNEYNLGISSTFSRLMEQKVNKKVDERVRLIQNKLMKQLANIRKQFEVEIEKVKKKHENYYFIFKQEIQNATISQTNKQKYNFYFDCVVLELEKYYLSAQILSKYQQKISFEDCSDKIRGKKVMKTGFIEKVYKIFEKNSQKIQKAGEIVKQIPYIGSMFKVIKNVFHCLGWIHKIKNESQCSNIMKIRPTLQQFNKFSYIIGYELYKYFKIDIVSDLNTNNRYQKNIWSKTSKMVNQCKTNQIVHKIYPHVQYENQELVEQMGKIHVAIFMASIAYGIFEMPGFGQVNGFNWGEIMGLIKDVEGNLMEKGNKDESEKGKEDEAGKERNDMQIQKKEELDKESRCEIF